MICCKSSSFSSMSSGVGVLGLEADTLQAFMVSDDEEEPR
jgi:hypothetical protein